mmetsp:Transcript_15752/g.27700  ORF Transcript_15752/g.27700 Transcript_15752/m.27700 type:complete len:81 (-) Transcript_15752:113-355(-)
MTGSNPLEESKSKVKMWFMTRTHRCTGRINEDFEAEAVPFVSTISMVTASSIACGSEGDQSIEEIKLPRLVRYQSIPLAP